MYTTDNTTGRITSRIRHKFTQKSHRLCILTKKIGFDITIDYPRGQCLNLIVAEDCSKAGKAVELAPIEDQTQQRCLWRLGSSMQIEIWLDSCTTKKKSKNASTKVQKQQSKTTIRQEW